MIIQEALKEEISKLQKAKIEEPISKAKQLLAFVLQISKEKLIIRENEEIEENLVQEYRESIKRLIKREPLQYVTNHQEFMKLNFFVNEAVLIPRPDTEILVEEILEHIKQIEVSGDNIKILDLCTGSGAIAVSLAKYIEKVELIAVDISIEALNIAKKNAKVNSVEGKIQFLQSNMFEKLDRQNQFDIIVSNPPYIETETISNLEKEVQKEPIIALDGGKTGLDFYNTIAKQGYKYLKDAGKLFLEIGYNQKESVSKILQKQEYKNIVCKKDLAGNDRVIECIK